MNLTCFFAVYKDRSKRDETTKRMSEILGVSLNDVRLKTRNMRTQFFALRRKSLHKKSGQGTDEEQIRWPFYKDLLFLADSVTPSQTVSNLVSEKIGYVS